MTASRALVAPLLATRQSGETPPRHRWFRRKSASLAVAAAVAVGALTGFGVTARLVRVDADIAQVEVAGQTVMVPVGGQTEAGGLVVRVEQITDTEVVIRISAV